MDGGIQCPKCGHELSMWHAPEPPRSERYAMRIAERVASWWFAATVLCLVAAWVLWNVAAKPFEPYPVIIFAVVSAVLATVASLQGPLILLSQRRSAARDRERDEEALRVAVNAEADLHRLEEKVDALVRRLEPGRGPLE
jgi:uncharacterized membrane protein